MFEWTLMKRLIWIKAAVISGADSLYETVTGAIVSFVALHAKALKKLVVNIEPVQDLHGYDAPWPPGGGVNVMGFASDLDDTIDGVRLILAANTGLFSISGTHASASAQRLCSLKASLRKPVFEVGETYTLFTDNQSLPLYMQFVYKNSGGTDAPMGYMLFSTGKVSFTIPNNYTEFSSFQIYLKSDATTVDGSFHVWLEKGTVSSSTFSPYANECPISGWDGADVWHTGENILEDEFELGTLVINTGAPAESTTYKRSKNFVRICPNTKYYVKSASGIFIKYYDENHTVVTDTWDLNNSRNVEITTNSKAYYLKVVFPASMDESTFCINYPSTDQDYHAYVGDSRQISWQDEAGTVYGGKAEIIAGDLTRNDKALVLDPTWNWTLNSRAASPGGYYFSCMDPNQQTDVLQDAGQTLSKERCSEFKIGNPYTTKDACAWFFYQNGHSYARVGFPDSMGIDIVEKFKTWLSGLTNPVVIKYPLETPEPISIDPTPISTQVGTNTIWADAGDVEVTYYAK